MSDQIVELQQSPGEQWDLAREAYLRLEWRSKTNAERIGTLTEDQYVQANRKGLRDNTVIGGGRELVETAQREFAMQPQLYKALAQVMDAPAWAIKLGATLPGKRHEVHLPGRAEPVRVAGTFFRVLQTWAKDKPASVNKREYVREGMATLGLPIPDPDQPTNRGGTYNCPPELKGKIARI